MAEADAFELGKRCEEVASQALECDGALIVRRPDLAAEVIDGVVAAPQDPVVRGEAVVVELVAQISQALPVAPADRPSLLRRERLGDQHVVIDRNGVPAHTPDQGREGVGAERHVPRGHGRSLLGVQPQILPGPIDPRDRGVLGDPDAERLGGAGQAPGELGGVEQGGVIAVPDTRKVGRRVDLGPYLLLAEKFPARRRPPPDLCSRMRAERGGEVRMIEPERHGRGIRP